MQAGRGLKGYPTVMPRVREHMYDELAQTKDVKMMPARMAAIALSLSLVFASHARAGSASGSPALALAAVIAPYASDLSPLDKVTVAALFDGESAKVAAKKIAVTADRIVCRSGNVDLTSRSCELTFKGGKHSLQGREANELFATMVAAAIAPEGAAGSNIASLSTLSCTLDIGAIKQKDGGGASCSFDSGN
jgi:hypothetical protein